MPKIQYVGPFDEVEVPAYRLRATPDEPVDVDDEVAEHLLAQADNWRPVKRADEAADQPAATVVSTVDPAPAIAQTPATTSTKED